MDRFTATWALQSIFQEPTPVAAFGAAPMRMATEGVSVLEPTPFAGFGVAPVGIATEGLCSVQPTPSATALPS